MIAELVGDGFSEEEALQIVVEQLGIPAGMARFILALEQGRVKGDVVGGKDEATGE